MSLGRAETGTDEAIGHAGRRPSDLFLEGLVALNARDGHRAVRLLSQASALQPSDWRCFYKLGEAYAQLGDARAADDSYRSAILANLEEGPAWAALLDLNRAHGELEAFVDFCHQCLARLPMPRKPAAMLFTALDLLGRPDDATAVLERAVATHPHCALTRYQYALLLSAVGRPAEALAQHRSTVEAAPRDPRFRVAFALSLLLHGRFEHGWRQFEFRAPKAGRSKPDSGAAWWDGDLARGGRIIVREEQGHGDIIQFSRFLSLFPAHFKVFFEVSPPLARLFGCLSAQIVAKGSERPEADFECHVGSLPLLFQTPDVSAPANGYLTSDRGLRETWARRLGGLAGLKVGLVWAGNPDYPLDYKRSMPLETLRPILDVQGVCFVSLQMGPARSELSNGGASTIHDWTDELSDYADTAALVSELDLVIGVDTSVIHLAGALGRPAWLLSRVTPHWAWQLSDGTGPWYPTVRQFRQKSPGNWREVVDRLRAALSELVGPG